jgi:hypothetical protein
MKKKFALFFLMISLIVFLPGLFLLILLQERNSKSSDYHIHRWFHKFSTRQLE